MGPVPSDLIGRKRREARPLVFQLLAFIEASCQARSRALRPSRRLRSAAIAPRSESQGSVLHTGNRQHAALVSKNAPQQVGGDEADRMIGRALATDDFVGRSSHFLRQRCLAFRLPSAPFSQPNTADARGRP